MDWLVITEDRIFWLDHIEFITIYRSLNKRDYPNIAFLCYSKKAATFRMEQLFRAN